MERREFLQKLGKSLLLISTVAVAGRSISKLTNTNSDDCPTTSSCDGCSKSSSCGLPKKTTSNFTNTK